MGKRTWLVGDTTDVETLITREEGIALDRDGRELSLALVLASDNGRECWGDDGAEGGKEDELHDDRGRRRELNGSRKLQRVSNE
jgi:hypothetical protein